MAAFKLTAFLVLTLFGACAASDTVAEEDRPAGHVQRIRKKYRNFGYVPPKWAKDAALHYAINNPPRGASMNTGGKKEHFSNTRHHRRFKKEAELLAGGAVEAESGNGDKHAEEKSQMAKSQEEFQNFVKASLESQREFQKAMSDPKKQQQTLQRAFTKYAQDQKNLGEQLKHAKKTKQQFMEKYSEQTEKPGAGKGHCHEDGSCHGGQIPEVQQVPKAEKHQIPEVQQVWGTKTERTAGPDTSEWDDTVNAIASWAKVKKEQQKAMEQAEHAATKAWLDSQKAFEQAVVDYQKWEKEAQAQFEQAQKMQEKQMADYAAAAQQAQDDYNAASEKAMKQQAKEAHHFDKDWFYHSQNEYTSVLPVREWGGNHHFEKGENQVLAKAAKNAKERNAENLLKKGKHQKAPKEVQQMEEYGKKAAAVLKREDKKLQKRK